MHNNKSEHEYACESDAGVDPASREQKYDTHHKEKRQFQVILLFSIIFVATAASLGKSESLNNNGDLQSAQTTNFGYNGYNTYHPHNSNAYYNGYKGYNNGYNGYSNGFNGYNNGYNLGYNGYNNGYNKGYNGYNNGYYNNGYYNPSGWNAYNGYNGYYIGNTGYSNGWGTGYYNKWNTWQ